MAADAPAASRPLAPQQVLLLGVPLVRHRSRGRVSDATCPGLSVFSGTPEAGLPFLALFSGAPEVGAPFLSFSSGTPAADTLP